jgi:hypothetical protein
VSNEIAPISLSHEVNPRVPGLSLKNFGGFQTEAAQVVAGFMPALTFRSPRRVPDLRQRGYELGVSFDEMHFSANVAGRAALKRKAAH